jgi:hypothetical protein
MTNPAAVPAIATTACMVTDLLKLVHSEPTSHPVPINDAIAGKVVSE